jgi:hypothetical protein
MPSESLREADALSYLRLKEQIESRPTNSNAVYSNGETRPVFIYSLSGTDTFVVEGDDYKFYVAQSLPGRVWAKWEAKPEIIAAQAAEKAAAEPEKPKNFQELQQQVEQQARNTMAERYANNRADNSDLGNLSPKWASFAEAAQRARNASFRS